MRHLSFFISFLVIVLIGSLNSCQQASPCTGEPTPEMSEFVNSWISSWNERDVNKFLDLYAEDAKILVSTGWEANGKEAIEKHFTGNMEAFPELQIDLRSVKAAGELIFVFYRASGTDSGVGIDNNPPTGKSFKDLLLLTCFGGKERTIKQFKKILKETGFNFTKVIRTRSFMSIVEAKKI